jgi:hypothetical protein
MKIFNHSFKDLNVYIFAINHSSAIKKIALIAINLLSYLFFSWKIYLPVLLTSYFFYKTSNFSPKIACPIKVDAQANLSVEKSSAKSNDQPDRSNDNPNLPVEIIPIPLPPPADLAPCLKTQEVKETPSSSTPAPPLATTAAQNSNTLPLAPLSSPAKKGENLTQDPPPQLRIPFFSKEAETQMSTSARKITMLTKQEKQISNIEEKITELITALATWDVMDLYSNEKKIKGIGEALRPLHPLKFLCFILLYLKDHLQNMKEKLTKIIQWNSFTKDLSKNLKTEKDNDNLFIYLDDFCLQLHLPAESKQILTAYINENQWKKFVLYLLDNSKSC